MATQPATNAREVFELLREDLAAIEREFGRDTVSNVRVITDIGEYLRAGGGKRIRPALLLLSSKLFGNGNRGAVQLGAVVEVIHTATLVHDDIIDEAQTRRGRPAANTQWGNSKCVLAGDWLYMQSFKVALQERNFRIMDLLTELTQQMVEGELLQAEKLGKSISREEHLDLIYRKTACLFATSMQLGGILAQGTEDQIKRLRDYGRNVGMAFQIVDDVLDLTASEEVLGKPVASDLREGKATLAVIFALERCTAAERTKIEKVLTDRAFNGVTHADILAILEKYNALTDAMDEALRYAEAARCALEPFPDNDYKRSLLWVPSFVVGREK